MNLVGNVAFHPKRKRASFFNEPIKCLSNNLSP